MSLYSEHNARGRKFAVCWCLVILLIILAVSILIFIAAVSLIVYFHSIDTKQHVTYDTFFDADSPYNKLCHNSYVFNRLFEVLISVGMMCCMPGACFSHTCTSTGFSLFNYNLEQVNVYWHHEFSLLSIIPIILWMPYNKSCLQIIIIYFSTIYWHMK